MDAIAYLVLRGDDQDAGRKKKLTRWARANRITLTATFEDEPHERFGRTLGGLIKVLDDNLGPVVVLDPADLDHPGVSWSTREALAKVGRKVLVVGATVAPSQAKKKTPRPRRGQRATQGVVERLVQGREDAVRAGSFGAGPAPFGYRRDYNHVPYPLLVLDSKEAPVVQVIFTAYLELRSIGKVVDLLDQNQYRTRSGAKHSRAGISWILKNRTYVGRVRIGEIESKGTHVALISWPVFHRVQDLIEANTHPRNRK